MGENTCKTIVKIDKKEIANSEELNDSGCENTNDANNESKEPEAKSPELVILSSIKE